MKTSNLKRPGVVLLVTALGTSSSVAWGIPISIDATNISAELIDLCPTGACSTCNGADGLDDMVHEMQAYSEGGPPISALTDPTVPGEGPPPGEGSDAISASFALKLLSIVANVEAAVPTPTGTTFVTELPSQGVTLYEDSGTTIGVDSEGNVYTWREDDFCLWDQSKTSPGVCGCGVSDTDGDLDGTPDCLDTDSDSDGDGTIDASDGCPSDSAKTTPGLCGCGTADIDSDDDGVVDCNDRCPFDPEKTDPGLCECGISDTDNDSDGTPDCFEVSSPEPPVVPIPLGEPTLPVRLP